VSLFSEDYDRLINDLAYKAAQMTTLAEGAVRLAGQSRASSIPVVEQL
jgi:hypothetical protein